MIITVKKIEMNANNDYQYSRIKKVGDDFASCTIEETRDELFFHFTNTDLICLEQGRKLKNIDKWKLLIQITEAVLKNEEYSFSICPENVCYDSLLRIKILVRDVVGEKSESKEDVFQSIQSLAGYLFQKKYSYEDYKEGGIKLLKQQKRTQYLLELKNVEQAYMAFKEHFAEEYDKRENTIREVGKQKFCYMTCTMWIALFGCAVTVTYMIYANYMMIQPQIKALQAERAYVENNLPGVAEALEDIPVTELDKHEKYLLATVSIKGQIVDTFDNETKELLLSKLSYGGDETLLDYWIYLGRLEADSAIDIAMRKSDNQLLLYAYLKKMDIISEDDMMSGEEKAQQLDALKGKVKSLADTLGISYEQTKGE